MLAFVFRLQFLFRRFMSAPLIHATTFFTHRRYLLVLKTLTLIKQIKEF